MKVCTFFGHADAPKTLLPQLRMTVSDLIKNHGVTLFYIGIQGMFDVAAHRVVEEMRRKYPYVRCYLVLSRAPGKNEKKSTLPCIVPEGIQTMTGAAARAYRNKWMLDRADYVVTYVLQPSDGAAKYKALAQKQQKTVINLPYTS